MKIGVFGDSFCSKLWVNRTEPVIWYNFLTKEHGHTVDCYGEAGSSIMFSAQLIEQHAANYDLVIWCVTTPGRFSFSGPTGSYHVTTANDQCNTKDIDLAKKHQVCVDYLKYVFDWPTENLIGRAIVSYMQTQFSNIMIIPCFPPPLSAEFNLYKLSENEIDFYFPRQTLPEVYKKYNDCRAGHISVDNQKILAQLINDNLSPGVFQTSYDNFIKPTLQIDQAFEKIQK
jgi:hypothetical protein